ncbi:MAG: hypothetical protein ACI9S8_002165 [Chlamydiales bacterium]|jgi:uncharacterized protein (TIGR02421 family)
MLNLSVDEIIKKIRKKESFSAFSKDGSFSISIEEYSPYICSAIHQGSQFRPDLLPKIALSKFERWQEEDPHTEDFILPLPIRIVGLDSRYEYDLNRKPADCIYDVAWGKNVWEQPPSKKDKELSLHKHSEFYRVIEVLVDVIEKMFGACIVYDIHSYNYKRIKDVKPPLFNIGSKKIDQKKFGPFVESWKDQLSKIEINNVVNETAINKVFNGNGYFLDFISSRFKNTLVLATEVKKIYVDETTGDIFPEVINDIRLGLKNAIISHASDFLDRYSKTKYQKKHDLLSSELDEVTKSVDYSIFKLLQNISFLEFINPKNIETEKNSFFSSNFRKAPNFKYRPIDIDVPELKRKLYSLPIQDIPDPTFQKMYQETIDGQTEQLEMLSLRGDNKFLYSSLKYFGEPENIDILNAKFILHCNKFNFNDQDYETMDANEVADEVRQVIKKYGFRCQVEISKRIPSRALFSPTKRTLKIKSGETFTRLSAKALGHHEIGVHMLTTANAIKQPLKILRVGLPVNTLTQEGLAILSEYLSGTLNIERIKMLAYRVLAVEHMIKYQNFNETFLYLLDECKLNQDDAYYLCVRVYRSGGFTKDYLYLRGFRMIMDYYKSGKSLDNLLLGKTALPYLPVLDELVNRGILKPPEYITDCFQKPVEVDPVMAYIVDCLK